jgi:crossover junction endodeoxyribonuclease RuvC
MTEPVRILGFDPGTRVAGFGVLDAVHGRTPSLVDCGAIRMEGKEIAGRLLQLHDALVKVVAEHRPTVFAIETVFHGKSFDSVLKVGESRGVGLLVAALNDLEIAEFSPAQVKKITTGNGRASKAQIQTMMVRILQLESAPGPSDVTDALALAFCYAQRLWRRGLPDREETPATLALKKLRSAKRRGARSKTERALVERAKAKRSKKREI